MVKHRSQRTRRTQVMRQLFLAALALVWGVSLSRAEPQGRKPSLPGAQTGTATGKIIGKTKPLNSATAQRRGKTATTKNSPAVGGKRDPFKLPPEPVPGRGGPNNMMDAANGGVLPPGARGLLIAQLKLEGVVREQTANKMIAVVTNDTRRAYFLTENESVYNGVVSKITPDAVYFKENVLDGNGRVTTREVVRRLGSVPGEGR